MVETYSQNANRNMRRPIVNEEIVDFMRTSLAQNTGFLKDLEDFARQENIPIIPHETVAYFRLLMQTLQPKHILEIGTAIGYSALLMAENSPQSRISTIERNPEMLGLARENLAKFDSRKQISLLEGEAMELLPDLPDDHFDFVFMDSAKSKYIVFLPEVLKKVKVGGLIVIDDIFQGGDVAKDISEIHRGQRAIYRGLQKLFDATLDNPDLTASLISMSDGLLLLRKNVDQVDLEMTEF
ncbi:O-methyltransferase [Streptococcus sp.]|uniref:O-methyltransferase n=1 Tax=Streptococcus sp. TaxID=1306 RepID=UPI0035A146DA